MAISFSFAVSVFTLCKDVYQRTILSLAKRVDITFHLGNCYQDSRWYLENPFFFANFTEGTRFLRENKTRMHYSRTHTARPLPYGGRSLSAGFLSRGSLSGGVSVQGSLCPGGLCSGGSLSRGLPDRDPPGWRPPGQRPRPPLWTDKHLWKHNLRKLRLRTVTSHMWYYACLNFVFGWPLSELKKSAHLCQTKQTMKMIISCWFQSLQFVLRH